MYSLVIRTVFLSALIFFALALLCLGIYLFVEFAPLSILITFALLLQLLSVCLVAFVAYFVLNVHFQLKDSTSSSPALHFHLTFASFRSSSLPLGLTDLIVTLCFINHWWLLLSLFLVFLFFFFLTSPFALIFVLLHTAFAPLSLFFVLFVPMLHSFSMFVKRRVVTILRFVIYVHVADGSH